MPVIVPGHTSRFWQVYNGFKPFDSGLPVLDPRVTVMFIILVASMVAVSFPAISSSGGVRVPNLLFFIGKHFGTGVILATAFVHLLPDSFSSLLDSSVGERYGNVEKWVGLIILGSLLTIFLVEYVSTTFVDHLEAEPSAPSTRQATPRLPITPLPSTLLLQQPSTLLPLLANTPKIMRLHLNSVCKCRNDMCICVPEPESEVAPHTHAQHHLEERRQIGRRRQIVGIFVLQVGIMIHSLVIGLTLAITSGADFTSLTSAIIFHQIFEGLSLGIRIAALPPAEHSKEHDEPVVSDIEGLGGINRPTSQTIKLNRASIPHLILQAPNEGDPDGGESSSYPNLDPLPPDSNGHKTASLRRSQSKNKSPLQWRGWDSLFGRSHLQQPVVHHNGYGGTSHTHHHHHHHALHSERLPSNASNEELDARRTNSLKATLSVLFAITTPLGMVLGMALWRENDTDQASMKLTQGVMSAISAGMLIYAATVEMIAGDFVYGDLEGHHHHHHGGDHEHEHSLGQEGTAHHHPSIGKRVTAVLSLLLGVVAMVLIGLGEPVDH